MWEGSKKRREAVPFWLLRTVIVPIPPPNKNSSIGPIPGLWTRDSMAMYPAERVITTVINWTSWGTPLAGAGSVCMAAKANPAGRRRNAQSAQRRRLPHAVARVRR